MDYRNYSKLLEQYNKLDDLVFNGDETREEVVGRQIEISKEIKKIQAENNEMIREYELLAVNERILDAKRKEIYCDVYLGEVV